MIAKNWILFNGCMEFSRKGYGGKIVQKRRKMGLCRMYGILGRMKFRKNCGEWL